MDKDVDAPPSSSAATTPGRQIKSHPCDQCRRRKIRCDSAEPCDRCIQSGLRCTRDILRKRRGPKKGSGSVIAKLRDETDQSLLPNVALPHYTAPILTPENAHPPLYRTSSGDSALPSPCSTYTPGYAPTSNPNGFAPCSVPVDNRNAPDASPNSHTPRFASNTHSPLGWRLATGEPYPTSQMPSPESSLGGFLTVSELAQRIFNDHDASLVYHAGEVNQAPPHSGLSGPAPSSTQTQTHSPTIGTAHHHFARSEPSLVIHAHNGTAKAIIPSPYRVGTQVAVLAGEVGLSPTLLSQCVKQYFLHLYPIWPAIHEATFLRSLNQQEPLSSEIKCLLLSLCAITMVNAAPPSDLNFEAKKDISRQLLFHVAHLRRDPDWTENPTLTTIIVSFFVANTYFELKQYRSHHFYLREAVGMALEQGLDNESTYLKMTHMKEICHRRMFALLFITERGFAIFRNKPILITRLPFLPTEHFDDEDPTILTGFQCLCQLFSLLDEKFVELWRHAAPEVDGSRTYVQNITAIQHDLNAMSFEMIQLPDIQAANVLITQQWLRLIFWQASMRQGLVSSTSSDPIFFYDYPIKIARTLCEVMSNLPMDAVIVHGAGIVGMPLYSIRTKY